MTTTVARETTTPDERSDADRITCVEAQQWNIAHMDGTASPWYVRDRLGRVLSGVDPHPTLRAAIDAAIARCGPVSPERTEGE
jgi:hypothetical protein